MAAGILSGMQGKRGIAAWRWCASSLLALARFSLRRPPLGYFSSRSVSPHGPEILSHNSRQGLHFDHYRHSGHVRIRFAMLLVMCAHLTEHRFILPDYVRQTWSLYPSAESNGLPIAAQHTLADARRTETSSGSSGRRRRGGRRRRYT